MVAAILDREQPEFVGHVPGEPDVRVLVEADRDNRGCGAGVDCGKRMSATWVMTLIAWESEVSGPNP